MINVLEPVFVYITTYTLQVNNACATGSSALYMAKNLIAGGKVFCLFVYICFVLCVWDTMKTADFILAVGLQI